jgi:hypothetical protein
LKARKAALGELPESAEEKMPSKLKILRKIIHKLCKLILLVSHNDEMPRKSAFFAGNARW